MTIRNDIYVRAHTRVVGDSQKGDSRAPWEDQKWPDIALVFDCESRTTPDQSLTFGFWQVCELRNDIYVPLEEGIVHDDGLNARELKLLRRFGRRNRAETAEDGCDRIRVYSRSKFIAEVLGVAIQAKALIVCFNSGFDLSRIAVDWETAEDGGWSLTNVSAEARSGLKKIIWVLQIM